MSEIDRCATLLAALHRETENLTELVRIDLTCLDASRIATLAPESGNEESVLVRTLIWDASDNRLLAVGDFGCAVFVPPRQ
jgi:hypothetical protein